MQKTTETFYPVTRKAWRSWLKKNHASKKFIWLVNYKKASKRPGISWTDAVEEALCFGWIDSKRISIDQETSWQFFSKRKPWSTWSKINKAKTEKLIAGNLMMEAGYSSIETAKENGSWIILDEVEELKIPKDLAKEFRADKDAKKFFLSLSRSARKAKLQSLVLAKRPETRKKRILEILRVGQQICSKRDALR